MLTTSVLASLNLPAAIEDLSGQTIPKSVLDKSAAVNDKGGLKTIDTFMQDLPELLQRNREVLDEVRNYPLPSNLLLLSVCIFGSWSFTEGLT